eukprot:1151802-Pelagomonas_calceolata.AAC.6
MSAKESDAVWEGQHITRPWQPHELRALPNVFLSLLLEMKSFHSEVMLEYAVMHDFVLARQPTGG